MEYFREVQQDLRSRPHEVPVYVLPVRYVPAVALAANHTMLDSAHKEHLDGRTPALEPGGERVFVWPREMNDVFNEPLTQLKIVPVMLSPGKDVDIDILILILLLLTAGIFISTSHHGGPRARAYSPAI